MTKNYITQCLFILLLIHTSLYFQTIIKKREYIDAIKIAEAETWDEYRNAIKNLEQSDPATRKNIHQKLIRILSQIFAQFYLITDD